LSDTARHSPGRRVLVTGARGLLGGVLVPHLKAAGHGVIEAPSRRNGGADLSVPDQAQRVLEASRPDVIVNLAALTDVDYCEAHPEEAYRANAALVANLARWSTGRARLIQVSSDQVYDGSGPHVEDHVSPINYYAYSKCLADEYTLAVRGTSLRTNFFGRSLLPGRPSFSDWIIDSIRAGKALTLYEDVLFSPLSMASLASAIATAIARPAPGIFNLGARGGMSKAEFGFQLAQAVGLPTSGLTRGAIGAAPCAARRPHDMRMDSSRFESTFGMALPALAVEIQTVARGYADDRR
jgi:dTDP-4-dehydrorhamnose reductase